MQSPILQPFQTVFRLTIEQHPNGMVQIKCNKQNVTAIEIIQLCLAVAQSNVAAMIKQAALLIDPNKKPITPETPPEEPPGNAS